MTMVRSISGPMAATPSVLQNDIPSNKGGNNNYLLTESGEIIVTEDGQGIVSEEQTAMAIKLSQLSAAGALSSNDIFPVVKGGITKYATRADILNAAFSAAERDAAIDALDLFPPLPDMISGRYYTTPFEGDRSTSVFTADTMYALPIYFRSAKTLTRIVGDVTVLNASGNVRLGIYNNDATNFVPTTLLLDAGTFSTGSTGEKALTISQAVAAGWYWLTWLADTNGAAATHGASSITGTKYGMLGATAYNLRNNFYFTASQAYGALPSNFPAIAGVGTANLYPRIMVKF